MSKLSDFIPKRARELEELLEPLRHQLYELQEKIRSYEKELNDLHNAAKAIGIVNRIEKPLGVTRRTTPKPTIKEAILDVLQDYPDGLIALDLLPKLNDRFSWKIVRETLSPQLSRLKQDGKLLYRDGVWKLPSKNDEGPAK
jgi:hypothetical protein